MTGVVPIRIFDLHCDTLARCIDCGEPIIKNSGHFDLARVNALQIPWVQTFACFIESDVVGEAAWERFCKMEALLRATLRQFPEKITLYDPNGAETPGVCQAMLSVEGGTVLGGEVSRVAELARRGVRMLTLVWNGENDLAGGVGSQKGLTAFGKACLAKMREENVLPDLSHMNDQSVDDVFSFDDGPLLCTHSNLRAVCGHPRNLTDAQFSEIVRRKGICGINLYPLFLNGEQDCAEEDVHRHLDRMLSLGGVQTVAVGTDFDGAVMPSFANSAQMLATLYESVVKWYDQAVADRLFYENAASFFKRTLGRRGILYDV